MLQTYREKLQKYYDDAEDETLCRQMHEHLRKMCLGDNGSIGEAKTRAKQAKRSCLTCFAFSYILVSF